MIKIYPISESKIKSIQRGLANSAGNITISSVNVSKTFVRSCSRAVNGGTVATNSNESGTLTPSGGSVAASSNGAMGGGSFPNFIGTRSISGGSTNLFSAEHGVSLTDSTTITATGSCRWEVIEYV
jgi:hypothetical protein